MDLPPKKLINYVGSPNFEEIGQSWFNKFVELGNLKPTDNVLDVGCGVGRMAIPLTKYLTKGRYEGFDLYEEGIKWCKENIECKFKNFHFNCIDFYHNLYNKNGKIKTSEYKFPYKSESFDFVLLTSIFTHMKPQDMKNYLSEISRVMKKDKTSFISYFLVDDISKNNIKNGLSKFDFKFKFDGFWSIDKINPEAAIAYDEQYIKDLYSEFNLKIIEPIHYGTWSGREKFVLSQDVIIAKKR